MKTAYFDRFTLNLPDEAIRECSQSGPRDEVVSIWVHRLADVLDEIGPADLRAELKEHGTWSKTELTNGFENRKRILWLAACNIDEGI